MSEPTTYSRVALKFVCPFARDDETEHIWSVKFAISGTEISTETEAATVALGLAGPILALSSAGTSLIGWLYYPPGSNVNSFQGTFAAGVHPGTQSAYTSTQEAQQAEVVVLARCPVGVNSLGRAKYLFKHIHNVPSGPTVGTLNPVSNVTTLLEPWNDGVGTADNVPVDPTTGVQGGPWQLAPALYTRQLRRGHRPPA